MQTKIDEIKDNPDVTLDDVTNLCENDKGFKRAIYALGEVISADVISDMSRCGCRKNAPTSLPNNAKVVVS